MRRGEAQQQMFRIVGALDSNNRITRNPHAGILVYLCSHEPGQLGIRQRKRLGNNRLVSGICFSLMQNAFDQPVVLTLYWYESSCGRHLETLNKTCNG